MSLKTFPLVSVIITTYKRPNMLKRAINSVLEQSYPNIEVIVVDDNDSNTEFRQETEEIMKDYKNADNVKYVKHPKNLNGAAARNTGIKNSSGEIVSFLDDDDYYLKDKIIKQVEYLFNNHEFDAVYCGWASDKQKWLFNKEGDLTFEILSWTNPISTNTILMYKKVALEIGGWDERFFRNQEAAFILRYFKNGYKIGVVNEVLVEVDTSDRVNAVNSIKTEEYIKFFLDQHHEQINECERERKGSKKKIYSNRYRAILLTYLSERKLFNALRIYFRMAFLMPIRFNKDLIRYIKSKRSI